VAKIILSRNIRQEQQPEAIRIVLSYCFTYYYRLITQQKAKLPVSLFFNSAIKLKQYRLSNASFILYNAIIAAAKQYLM